MKKLNHLLCVIVLFGSGACKTASFPGETIAPTTESTGTVPLSHAISEAKALEHLANALGAIK